MRPWLALLFRAFANRIYSEEHRDRVEVLDEYGIRRCEVYIISDNVHGVNAERVELPEGWVLRNYRDGEPFDVFF